MFHTTHKFRWLFSTSDKEYYGALIFKDGNTAMTAERGNFSEALESATNRAIEICYNEVKADIPDIKMEDIIHGIQVEDLGMDFGGYI